jgi:hypothetical protein
MGNSKIIVFCLAIFFTLSMVVKPASAATLDTKGMENLVKATEAPAAAIKKHIDIYEPQEIKYINTKTITDLSASITKAKAGLKNYKGKNKTSFTERVENSAFILTKGKMFNNTITKGAKLIKDLKTFQTQFKANPFSSEKALNELIKKNNLYTAEKKKLINASAIEAFSIKYQNVVEKEISQGNTFYKTNKRIDNFISFAENNDTSDVWDEILSIDHAMTITISNKTYSNWLTDKWNKMYVPKFVTPEQKSVEKFIQDYETAINTRDMVAYANLFYFETEEQRAEYIDLLEEAIAEVPEEDLDLDVNINFELKFVYGDEAVLILNEDDFSIMIFLIKADGNWLFHDPSEL